LSAPVALQVLSSPRGGGAVHVRALTPGLARRGYRVEIALPEQPGHLGRSDFEVAGGRLVSLPKSSTRRMVALASTIRHERPAVVHAHGARAGLEAAVALRISSPAPLVVTVHGYTTPFRSRPRRAIQHAVERWMARRARLLFAVCDAELRALEQAGLGTRSRIERLRVGYPLGAFERIDDTCRRFCRDTFRDVAGTGLVVLTVCRLDEPRDLTTLVDAFCRARASLPDATLWIVGDGPLRPAIEQQIARLDAEGFVHLFGFRRDVPNLMAAADVFVLTTDAHEGLPIALLEAQAAGLPVIATDAGGAGESIEPEGSGVLVPRCDADALETALQAIGRDRERRDRMGTAGRRFVRSFADADTMAAEVVAAYRAL